VAHRVSGVARATALARKRSGRQFDPTLAALLCARAEEIFGGIDAVLAWRTVIAAEPALAVELSPDQLARAVRRRDLPARPGARGRRRVRLDARAPAASPGPAGRGGGGRDASLTAREVEVLVLLARGLSNKQIAERLVITPKTAGNHVEHIYAKIGASSRAAAAMFAVQHGLLPEEKLAETARP
jgi:DNA-binding NarL/FixJ family response regulator